MPQCAVLFATQYAERWKRKGRWQADIAIFMVVKIVLGDQEEGDCCLWVDMLRSSFISIFLCGERWI
jgi:hypothetical protein